MFIIAYDADVVSESILQEKRYSKSVTSREYLEKIVQVSYRIPTAGQDQTESLIDSYLDTSGTKHLFDHSSRSLITERNARNPRRIKRFINGLILAYQRHPEWTERDQQILIRWQLLHTYFPESARLWSEPNGDPIAEFIEYERVRRVLLRGVPQNDQERELVAHALKRNQLDGVGSADLLRELEKRVDENFQRLAEDRKFVSLLDPLRSKEARYAPRLRENTYSRLARRGQGSGCARST